MKTYGLPEMSELFKRSEFTLRQHLRQGKLPPCVERDGKPTYVWLVPTVDSWLIMHEGKTKKNKIRTL